MADKKPTAEAGYDIWDTVLPLGGVVGGAVAGRAIGRGMAKGSKAYKRETWLAEDSTRARGMYNKRAWSAEAEQSTLRQKLENHRNGTEKLSPAEELQVRRDLERVNDDVLDARGHRDYSAREAEAYAQRANELANMGGRLGAIPGSFGGLVAGKSANQERKRRK
jgi:hypothetical protein